MEHPLNPRIMIKFKFYLVSLFLVLFILESCTTSDDTNPLDCPEVSFSRDGGTLYKLDQYNSNPYWTINNNGTIILDNEGNFKLDTLNVGTYEICINTEPSNSCPNGTSYCETVIIELSCPEVSFSRDGDTLYKLDQYNSNPYWTINNNGTIILDNEGNFKLDTLNVGTYEICINTEPSNSCPNGTSYCETVIIELSCPEVSFSRDGNTLYKLDQYNSNPYWTINNNGTIILDNEGNFKLDTLNVGTYEICINTEPSNSCPNGTSYCETVIIELSCPEVSFSRDGGTLYKLDQYNSNPYWTINNNGTIILDNEGNFKLDTLNVGTYEICINTEPSNSCPNGTSYCETVIIELSCPEVSFSRDGDTLYKLDQYNSNPYWTINNNGTIILDNEGNFKLDTLNVGTYEICINTEPSNSCPNGTSYCETVIIELSCPEVSFSRDGDTLYKLDQYNSNPYWTINNNGTIILDNEGNFKLDTLNVGTYEICINTEPSNSCPNGTSYCETVIIE